MPTWGKILEELREYKKNYKKPPFDYVRRKYLNLLAKHTKANIILYATDWLSGNQVDPSSISITDEDINGLMEVMHGLKGGELFLILHSPGGNPDTTKALVYYLRSKFDKINVIVPHMAMSAATMLSCSADAIYLGKHSFLGPIDPQIMYRSKHGLNTSPAQAILDQFEMAKEECKDPENLPVWMPILELYGPSLIVQCKHALDLSEKYVKDWLRKYMFKNDENKDEKANRIAGILANHREFKSHSYHITRDEAESFGLNIKKLEDDEKLQDLVLSVFHSTIHTFTGTPAVKIIENHKGAAYIRQMIIPVPQKIEKKA